MTTLSAPHFVRGVVVDGDAVRHRSRDLGADFVTPAIDLDALITPRSQLPPLLDVKLSEIIDFLVETGQRKPRACRSLPRRRSILRHMSRRMSIRYSYAYLGPARVRLGMR